jgi:hypothetical protein
VDQEQDMLSSNATAPAQADAANILTFSPQVELQARRLRRLFGFAPEAARVLAGLAFASEGRA